MRPETLREVGEAIWGAEWVGPMAAALRVAPRTVRRWAADQQDIPPNVPSELIAICRDRRGELAETIDLLEAVSGL